MSDDAPEKTAERPPGEHERTNSDLPRFSSGICRVSGPTSISGKVSYRTVRLTGELRWSSTARIIWPIGVFASTWIAEGVCHGLAEGLCQLLTWRAYVRDQAFVGRAGALDVG